MFSVAVSGSALEFDTLPALKTGHFSCGAAEAEHKAAHIYTLARLYVLGGALRLSLCAFERSPPPESRVLFALAASPNAAGGRLALLSLAPGGAKLAFAEAQSPPPLWAPLTGAKALPAKFFAGEDEQGWYWGARVVLTPPEDTAGLRFEEGADFCGALYKFNEGMAAFGSSVKQSGALPALCPARFGHFRVECK